MCRPAPMCRAARRNRCRSFSGSGDVAPVARIGAPAGRARLGSQCPRKRVRTEAHGRIEATATPRRCGGRRRRVIDIDRIMHDIPHRYPFLMIDRVVDVVLNSVGHWREERLDQRAIFRWSFSQSSGDAGGADHREHGADRRRACGRDTGPRRGRQGCLLHVDRGSEIPPSGGTGRPVAIHVLKERNRGNVWKFQAVARVDGCHGRRGNLCRNDHGPCRAEWPHRLSNAKMANETVRYMDWTTSGNND